MCHFSKLYIWFLLFPEAFEALGPQFDISNIVFSAFSFK